MANEKVKYKEPKNYFTPEMSKAIKEYDRQQAEKKKAEAKKPAKKSK